MDQLRLSQCRSLKLKLEKISLKLIDHHKCRLSSKMCNKFTLKQWGEGAHSSVFSYLSQGSILSVTKKNIS